MMVHMTQTSTPEATVTSYRTSTVNSKWMGARATMTSYRTKARKDSERVVTFAWKDDNTREGVKAGDLVLLHQTGDGTKGTLETFNRTVIAGGTQSDVDAYLSARLPL